MPPPRRCRPEPAVPSPPLLRPYYERRIFCQRTENLRAFAVESSGLTGGSSQGRINLTEGNPVATAGVPQPTLRIKVKK